MNSFYERSKLGKLIKKPQKELNELQKEIEGKLREE